MTDVELLLFGMIQEERLLKHVGNSSLHKPVKTSFLKRQTALQHSRKSHSIKETENKSSISEETALLC